MDVLSTASKFGSKIFRDKSDKDTNLLHIMSVLQKYSFNLHILMWKMTQILTVLSGCPLCTPGYLGDTTYDDHQDKLEPFILLGASWTSIPVSCDSTHILIASSVMTMDYYKWALYEFISYQELAERLTYANLNLKAPLFRSEDRIEYAFKNRMFPSSLDKRLKELWMSHKNYILDFKLVELKDSEFMIYRDLTQKYVNGYKTSVFGWVNNWYYLAYMSKIPSLYYYEKVYCIDAEQYNISKTYEGDDDIIQDIIDDNLTTVIDESVSLEGKVSLVSYKVPTKLTITEFTDMKQFNNDLHPLSYNSTGVIYSNINVFLRQTNKVHKNVDKTNEFFYTGPPRFMININDLPYIESLTDKIITLFSKIDVYTDKLEFVKQFEVQQTSRFRDLYSN
jgi:hypothetical protein